MEYIIKYDFGKHQDDQLEFMEFKFFSLQFELQFYFLFTT